MSSRKRSSRRRLSTRARSQTKLVRNGIVMKIVIPVAIAGAGVAAYLLWKKSRARAAYAAAPMTNADGSPNASPATLSPSIGPAISPVDALIRDAGSVTKDAANAAYWTAQDAIKRAKAAAVSGIGSYYDVSAAGAPYQGMFGLGSTAMSTVEPHDLARRAKDFAPVRKVTRQFASPQVRTGGMFARDLFTGIMG